MSGNHHRSAPTRDNGADFARQFDRFPPFGEVVEVAMAGAGAAYARHSLGRRFQRAMVLEQSVSAPVVVYDADTVEALGLSPNEWIAVDPYASATGSVWVWVI